MYVAFGSYVKFFYKKHVSFVFITGIQDVVSIDRITSLLISCYDNDAQTDAQLACFQGSRLPYTEVHVFTIDVLP